MPILVKKKRLVKYQSGNYCQFNEKRKDYRIGFLLFFFILFSVIVILRLFKLQVLDNNYYIALASGQHEIFQQLYPERGNIYAQDKKGKLIEDVKDYAPLAINKNMNLLYAVPKDVGDPEAVLEVLKGVFGVEVEEVEEAEEVEEVNEAEINLREESGQSLIDNWREKLNKKDDPYEPLKHFVSDEDIEKIKEYNLEGIKSTKEMTRYYPEKNIGGQLIGFVGKQAENYVLKGYYGIEGCYDKELAGEPGFLRSELDTFGRWIAVAGKDIRKANDGYDIILTIDKSIQYYVCEELNKSIVQYGAEKGSIVIMDVQTGRIIAMCNSPDFDPNKYNEIEDINVFNNSILFENYEPGSVFKAITMAVAIDSGKVDPFTSYQDTGEIIISRHPIKNSDLKAHGWQTMTQVLEKSLNTGAVFAARKVGGEEFKRYIEAFGFGQKTDIDLCQEAKGDVRSLNEKNEIYLATASFGQGITATPIQLVRAFAAIANEGKLVQPYLVDKIIDKDGNIIKENKPKVVGQVISPQTSKLLGSMLVSVVKNGHSKKAAIPGYLVAGKTGTAQVPDYVKGGYSNKTIHTFVGYVPFNQPKFVMLVKLNNPAKIKFAADSGAPIFSKIAKFVLDYYEIPPEIK